MRGTPLLEVRGLRVAFGPGAPAVAVEALDIARGETLAVIGPNGAGKSTLFAALACLRPWTAGTLRFDGAPVDRPGPGALAYRRQLAVVMQDPLLLDTTALDNAAQGLRYRGVGRREARATAAAWLERLGVGHLTSRPARHLSGGEAQRVSLARAMALAPKLLLLDEPFAALDAPSRAAFIDDLRAVLAETGTTALLSTHERSEALMLADRVAVLLGGRIAQVGTPTEVFETPATEAVAAFVGVETIEPGVIEATSDGVAVVAVGGAAVGARTAAPPAGAAAAGTGEAGCTGAASLSGATGGRAPETGSAAGSTAARGASLQPAAGAAPSASDPAGHEAGERGRQVRVEARSHLPAGTPVFLCLRPEDVAVSLPAEAGGVAGGPGGAGGCGEAGAREAPASVRNRLPGVVRSVVPLEGQFRVMLDCGFPLVALVTKRAFLELDLREGRPVVAWFKATAAHLLPHRGARVRTCDCSAPAVEVGEPSPGPR